MQGEHRINILHLITSLEVGGAEMMLLRLVSLMDSERFSNHVVTLSNIGPVGRRIADIGIPVLALDINSFRSGILGLAKLWFKLIRKKPDILQTWLYHSDLVGFVIGRLACVKNISWNIRGAKRDFSGYGISTRLALRLCKLLSPFPDIVIANSKAGQKFHNDIGYRPKQWLIIPNGIDLDLFKPDDTARKYIQREIENKYSVSTQSMNGEAPEKIQDHTYLVGIVARYVPIKDHSTFIKGSCLLLDKRKDVRFILVGKGVTPENLSLLEEIPDKYRGYFYLLGERGDIQKIMAALDVFCLVSHGEGFSNVICEAMACNVPCVVTDVGDSAQIVGDTGVVIPVKSPESFASAVQGLLDLPPNELKKAGERARSRIESEYSLDKISSRYEELYLHIPKARR
ncbi:glycosyltransferase [Thermodesulfobacteriota bacterium]